MKKKKFKPPDLNETILSRIGKSPKERFTWIVNLMQERGVKTPGDIQNRQLEFAYFFSIGRFQGLSFDAGVEETPNPEELMRMENKIWDIIKKASEREPIEIKERDGELVWFESKKVKGCYLFERPYDWQWEDLVDPVMKDLLLKFGHLLKICPAPLSRSREDICGSIFVASRPNQIYCTSKCQTRMTTRNFRKA